MYVLDTDVLSLLMEDRLPEETVERIRRVPANRAAITSITLGELHCEALRSQATARWLAAVCRASDRTLISGNEKHFTRARPSLRELAAGPLAPYPAGLTIQRKLL